MTSYIIGLDRILLSHLIVHLVAVNFILDRIKNVYFTLYMNCTRSAPSTFAAIVRLFDE